MSNPTRYNAVAQALHWSIALLILGMLPLGWYMSSLGFTPLKFQLIQLHKSIGILILLLVVLRILWRMSTKVPALPAHMPLWQKAGAHLSHYGLYYLMFSMPITGYIMSDAAGYHPTFFGLPVPILTDPNPETASFLATLHETFAFAIVGLIALHVAAALYHHVWVKDDTLRRMLPAAIANRISQ